MTTDTQKTWTLELADQRTVADVPHEHAMELFWKAMHGYGTLEQVATATATN